MDQLRQGVNGVQTSLGVARGVGSNASKIKDLFSDDGVPFFDKLRSLKSGLGGSVEAEGSSGVQGVLSNPLLGKAAGALGLFAGILQGAAGVQELQRNDLLDGVTDTVGGGLNSIGGTSLLTGATEFAGPIGFVTSGIAAEADGTREIVHGLDTHNNEKVAVGAVKDVGGGAMIAGGVVGGLMAAGAIASSSVIGLPVGAALFGIGAAIYGGAWIYDHRDEIGKAVTGFANTVANGASAVGTAVEHGAVTVANTVVNGATAVGKAVAGGLGAVGNAVSGGLSAAGNAIAGGLGAAASGLSSFFHF